MRQYLLKYVVYYLLLFSAIPAFSEDGTFNWDMEAELYPGIKLAEISRDTPRNLKLYCARIDAESPELYFKTTGRHLEWAEDKKETLRVSTRKFLETNRSAGVPMVLAINADAFSPWPAPWNEEAPTNVLGLAIADNVLVSPATKSPSFVVYKDASRKIAHLADHDLKDIEIAVSGFSMVLESGKVTASGEDLHPRTGLGLSKDTRWLFFLLIDGRRHASQGANTREVGEWLQYFGAHDGMNMDGGGSSTMVRWEDNSGAILVNSPVGSGVNWLELPKIMEEKAYKPTERNNGNNLGVCLRKSPAEE